MKFFKIFYTGTLLTCSLLSCTSIHRLPVPTALDNAPDLSAKNLVLTETEKKTWSQADLMTDTIPGMSIAKAYEFLRGKKAIPVIVAVNDSGVDVTHEDLKPKVWINEDEIAGNGIDDDQNGYIDDIHGWNFLGVIYDENLEITRIIKEKALKFEGKTPEEIRKKDQQEYQEYMDLKEIFDEELAKASETKNKYEFYYQIYEQAHTAMVKNIGKEDYTAEEVATVKADDMELLKHREMTLQILESGSDHPSEMEQIQKGIDHYTSKVDNYYNLDFYPRKILNNDENDFSTKVYGDADVSHRQEDEIHGTHVAGIIAALSSAKIMTVRCVPNGDEYDKDVALGIRYAVDNGAKIINTSFGKGYSPQLDWVHDAIKYAAKHDVLMVNAVGNSSEDVDISAVFPNDSADLAHEISDNMITVGAIGSSFDQNMLAPFSNYGKNNVDIFAPGAEIYASVPENQREFLSGTSMASPSTAGVAAIIRSYYPQLSASQVKHILMNSGTKIDTPLVKPGTSDELVSLSELCVSGRIVNAYNAVKMAEEMLAGKR